MNTSQKIAFFGTEDFSAVSLKGLLQAGFDISVVITKPDSKKGRGQRLAPPEVKQVADSYGIPVLQPTELSTILPTLQAMQPLVGVLVSYGKIIPQSVIDVFTPGIINLHPSLLPKYRGPSPIESAIYNGDTTTGISVMQLSKAMDAGPVYHQVEMPLNGTETGPSLSDTLAELGTAELIRVLPSIINGTLQPTEQDHDSATYCSLLQKSGSSLSIMSMTAIQAERHVRAYLAYPRSRIEVSGHPVIITKAHVSQSRPDVGVRFSDDNYLAIDQLIAPSGKAMTTDAFMRGYSDSTSQN